MMRRAHVRALRRASKRSGHDPRLELPQPRFGGAFFLSCNVSSGHVGRKGEAHSASSNQGSATRFVIAPYDLSADVVLAPYNVNEWEIVALAEALSNHLSHCERELEKGAESPFLADPKTIKDIQAKLYQKIHTPRGTSAPTN